MGANYVLIEARSVLEPVGTSFSSPQDKSDKKSAPFENFSG
jgi:hypothetical protein